MIHYATLKPRLRLDRALHEWRCEGNNKLAYAPKPEQAFRLWQNLQGHNQFTVARLFTYHAPNP